jgi:hypothetical protein
MMTMRNVRSAAWRRVWTDGSRYAAKGATMAKKAAKGAPQSRSLKRALSLDRSLEHPENVEALAIDANDADDFAGCCDRFTRLRCLYASNCELKAIPEAWFGLTTLEVVELGWNKLTEIPQAIGHLKGLRDIDLEGNRLKSVSDSICALSELEVLGLAQNRLRELPESIGRLTKLEGLEVASNRLERLPESLGMCRNLTILSVGGNKLTAIPNGIGRLQKLRHFYLQANRIRELPEEIGALTELCELQVDHNKLRSVPASLGRLKRLKYLTVSDNRLTSEAGRWLIDHFRPPCVLSLNPDLRQAVEAWRAEQGLNEKIAGICLTEDPEEYFEVNATVVVRFAGTQPRRTIRLKLRLAAFNEKWQVVSHREIARRR